MLNMPAEFDACVKGGGKVRTKQMGDGKYMNICIDKMGTHAGYMKKKESLVWTADLILEDKDITVEETLGQTVQEGKGTVGKPIRGTLMARESRNGRIYELDAMIKASLDAKLPLPVSMNHTDDVRENVALITKLIPTGEGIDYQGIVYNTARNPDAVDMMQKKLINKISIEADNPVTSTAKDGKVIVKGFELMGAGFVKYAGIPNASASIAEALEKYEEVEDMEEHEKLSEMTKSLEAKEKSLADAMDRVKSLEAAIVESKATEIKALEESINALHSEFKTLKEQKKSGMITEENKPEYRIVEKLSKDAIAPKTFVFEGRGGNTASFYAVNPEEFY